MPKMQRRFVVNAIGCKGIAEIRRGVLGAQYPSDWYWYSDDGDCHRTFEGSPVWQQFVNALSRPARLSDEAIEEARQLVEGTVYLESAVGQILRDRLLALLTPVPPEPPWEPPKAGEVWQHDRYGVSFPILPGALVGHSRVPIIMASTTTRFWTTTDIPHEEMRTQWHHVLLPEVKP